MPIVGWIIGGVIALAGGVGTWAYRKYRENRAKRGGKREKKLERREGFWGIRTLFSRLIKRSEEEKKEEKQERKRIKEEGKQEKKQGAPRSEVDADNAAEKGVKAAEAETNVKEDTEALGGRGVGLLASVKAVLGSVSNYVARAKQSMKREEQDVQALENLMRSLNNIGNFATIDQRVANYLSQVFSRIAQAIRDTVEGEYEKERLQGELIKQLRGTAKEARDVIKDANTALGMLQSAKRKERRNFKQELRDISKAIDDKKKELRGIRRSKGANPVVIAQLGREISLMEQQRGFVNSVNNQLQATYRTMDTELREMKNLLRVVSRREKQVTQSEKTASKRERGIEGRYNSLHKLAEEIEKSFETLTASPGLVHQFAIDFSGKLSIFYQKYKEIISGDLEFEGEVQKILLLNITITMQMEAYERLSASLEQAEKAVEEGLGATTDIVAAIVGGQDQKASLKQLTQEIKKAGGEIDYETRVDLFLQQLTMKMEEQERVVNAQVGELINEDKRVVMEIDKANQEQSAHIGQTMATMMNRKIQIDNTYMSEARKFEQQLGQRNRIAVGAYRQARRIEARAAPQPTPVLRPGFAR